MLFHRFGNAVDQKGNALPGWQVECVLASDGTTVATIYADENSTPISTVSGIANRAVTDDAGNFDYFVDEGNYSENYYDESGVLQGEVRYVPMYGLAAGQLATGTKSDFNAACLDGDFVFTDSVGSYAPLDSPAFINNPTAPTQTVGNNSTRLATTAFVKTADDAVISTINTTLGNYALTSSLSSYLAVANNLSDLGNAATARTNLGLGTAAVSSTGTSGATIPFLNGANTWGATQTVPTVVLTKKLTEQTFTITDAAGFAIAPTNGTMQQVTLGASRTPVAANWANGDSVKLRIDDGSARTITWTTMGVVWLYTVIGGSASAPTLATSGWTHVELWQEGGTIYGALVGYSA